MRVFVLLFNARTENEGIHSLKIGDRNVVLAFEDEDDATRYALLLEAQDFMQPTVEALEQEEVEEFCHSVDYECQIVPRGFVPQTEFDRLLLAPPERNLAETDWQVAQSKSAGERLEEDSIPSNPDLDRIRRQLEGLL